VATAQHSRIDMSISVEQNTLIFTCTNTDYSDIKKPETEKGGIGLENVRRRLELMYPGKHTLSTGPQDGKYMVDLQIHLA
jgi:LytS/YehU family sensor histidine kinase